MEILKLRITRENLYKIVSGEKKTEYRDVNDYYVSRFCEKKRMDDGRFKIIQFDQLFLFCNEENATIKVEKVWHHRFTKDNLCEEFKENDFMFKIELGEVIESNINLKS